VTGLKERVLADYVGRIKTWSSTTLIPKKRKATGYGPGILKE
jgi:hypothetical protein